MYIKKSKISIGIGEYYANSSPSVIHTILGSCVAVCLFDPTTRIGGMNHIFLPGKADLDCYNNPARYGVNAMELLINAVTKLGMKRKNMTAKVFGGGHLFPSIPYENGIGKKIAMFVLRFLQEDRIPVINQDLGGTCGRKIFYHTDTGDTFVKRIVSMQNRSVFMEEEKSLKHLRKDVEKTGDVALFDQADQCLKLRT